MVLQHVYGLYPIYRYIIKKIINSPGRLRFVITFSLILALAASASNSTGGSGSGISSSSKILLSSSANSYCEVKRQFQAGNIQK